MRLTMLSVIALSGALATAAWADKLVLQNGRTIDGKFVSASQKIVNFQGKDGKQYKFNRTEVRSLNFEGLPQNGASAQQNGQPAQQTQPQKAAQQQKKQVQANGTARLARVIPTGTNVLVRTEQAIDSTTASEGQAFQATIVQAVRDNAGNVAIPAGSRAELVLDRVRDPGAVGSAGVIFGLKSVQAGNQRYLVSAETVEQTGREGLGANMRTATMTGGGAALGAIIGAVAGGGTGAGIGAIVGGAAGGTAQVMTRDKEVRIPPETVLTFQLDSPLHLRPQ